MLVLSFERMNTLHPTLCVILFHAFESSIMFQKPSFYGLSGRPRAVDRFPRGHCFGWLSSNSSYHCKWRPTRLKLYSQSEERTLFRAVCELFWCGLWKQRNGGKYGCCNFFLKYFVKIGHFGKKFTHRLILCSFIYKSMYFTSGFVEKYDGNGLKKMTMWQKNLSNSACASRGFVGLQIKRDGGDLKIQSNSHLSAVKALKLKLNTLTWGIFGWFVYSVRYLVKFIKVWGSFLDIPSPATGHSCLSNGRTQSAFYRTWILTTGRSISSAKGCHIFNQCYFLDLHWSGLFKDSSFFPLWNLYQWFFCLSRFNIYGTFSFR